MRNDRRCSASEARIVVANATQNETDSAANEWKRCHLIKSIETFSIDENDPQTRHADGRSVTTRYHARRILLGRKFDKGHLTRALLYFSQGSTFLSLQLF